jgi:hypothetical protein
VIASRQQEDWFLSAAAPQPLCRHPSPLPLPGLLGRRPQRQDRQSAAANLTSGPLFRPSHHLVRESRATNVVAATVCAAACQILDTRPAGRLRPPALRRTASVVRPSEQLRLTMENQRRGPPCSFQRRLLPPSAQTFRTAGGGCLSRSAKPPSVARGILTGCPPSRGTLDLRRGAGRGPAERPAARSREPPDARVV